MVTIARKMMVIPVVSRRVFLRGSSERNCWTKPAVFPEVMIAILV
jgi:hypothetical protein